MILKMSQKQIFVLSSGNIFFEIYSEGEGMDLF